MVHNLMASQVMLSGHGEDGARTSPQARRGLENVKIAKDGAIEKMRHGASLKVGRASEEAKVGARGKPAGRWK